MGSAYSVSIYKSRPIIVAESLKELVVTEGLKPGDRLPAENELISRFKMSKGTIREATRLLEAQGLIKTRTGPGGGCFVHEVSELRTISLLSNYFYFKELTISNIYEMRKLLEPKIAGSLAGKLSQKQLENLRNIVNEYKSAPKNEDDDRAHHESALKFHGCLANYADNVLLGFIVRFMSQVLTEVTINRKLFRPINYQLWREGYRYHNELIKALELGNADEAKSIMYAHMCMAEDLMLQQEARLASGLKNIE